MNLKKNLKAVAFSLCLGMTGGANAGIPVADGLQLAQTIAMSMAEQMMHEMLAEARNKLSEKLAEAGMELDKELAQRAEDFAWEMYEETVQKEGYGWLFDVGRSCTYLVQSEECFGSGSVLKTYTEIAQGHIGDQQLEDAMNRYENKVTDQRRAKEGMQSDQEHIQRVMDKDITNKVMKEEALAEISKRYNMIQDLRKKASDVSTIKQRQDLQVAIGIEQLALQNEQIRLNTLNDLTELEDKTEMYRVSKEVEKKWESIEFSYE